MIRVGRSYNLSGNILLDKDQHEAALHHYLQSLEIFENTNNTKDTNITYCYNNIGTCYTRLERYEEALTFFNKSLAIRRSTGSPNEVAVTLMLIGMMHFAQGALAESEDYLLQAIKIFKELSNTYDISHTALQLATLYKQQNDFKQACEYLDLHLSLQNELNKEDKRRSISEALAQSKMEQRESEAQLLRQKNAEIEEFARKLQISNEELNQFAHIVSHDLKEPLRMISCYTGLLHDRLNVDDDPEAKQFMTFIDQGTERMNNLINELLAYSKVGASYKIQPTDLNDVLKIARMNLSGLLNDKAGVIEETTLPTIDSDRTMMLQLFQNLLGNGLKYNSSPTPTVGVHCRLNKSDVELHFYDNGMGIPEEYRKKVFDIFRRLPDSKDIQGTGIGLSICHKIVAQLKGKIWIDENKPEGSIFKVSLPMR
jgi:signal transduction histidine kinase